MSTILLGFLTIVLLYVIILQISKVTDLVSSLKKDKERDSDQTKGYVLAAIGFGIIIFSLATCFIYKDKLLPEPASEQGVWIDNVIKMSIVITGIVFIITQFLLFYFVAKFYYKKDRKALFFSDNHTIEIAWTVVPSIVLVIMVGLGLQKWFKIFSPAPKEAIVIEVIGKQYAWMVRYSGKDKVLGKRDFTLVNPDNELGINWKDVSSQDDFMPDEIVLPVNKPVLVKIGALDVIHDFYLPQFRLMMDAVPGVPTQMWFRPIITTAEMRKKLNNPTFDYVLACNKLCGSGHYNMQKKVRIVTEAEYTKWYNEQKSYYSTVVQPAVEPSTKVADTTTLEKVVLVSK